jgi:hypothetical protein
MSDSEGTLVPGFQSSLFFETPEEIYARVFRELKPRTPVPELHVEFCRFANADSFIRLENGSLRVRISDLLAAAPAPVMEALAYILLGKLYRKPVARLYNHRYRLYLNRRDMRRQAHLVRQIRGRKFVSGPAGTIYNLEEIFERLNRQFFDGLLGMPRLAQCHYHQPDFRSAGPPGAGVRIRDVSRNVTFAISGGPQWGTEAGAYEGISRCGKEIPAIQRSQRHVKAAIAVDSNEPL